jgi:hypothetical protein
MAPRPLAGSSDEAEVLVAGLSREAARVAATARLLRSLSTRGHAVWESPAGERFGAAASAVVGALDRMATRYAASASAVRGLGLALREAEALSAAAIRDYDVAWPQFLRHGDLMALAVASPAPSVASTAEVHRSHMVNAGERVAAAQRRNEEAWRAWEDADRACATVLRALRADGLADSAAYNLLTGAAELAGGIGDVVGLLGPLTLLPALRVVDGVGTAADVVAVSADAAVLGFYGDGDAGMLAIRAALASVGPVSSVVKRSATATNQVATLTGLEPPRTRAQVRARRALTSTQRLRVGLTTGVAESLGKEAANPVHVVAWTRPGRGFRAGAGWARATAKAQATAFARNAWLDDWAAATTNGVGSRRTYVAARVLETSGPALQQTVPRQDDGPRAGR